MPWGHCAWLSLILSVTHTDLLDWVVISCWVSCTSSLSLAITSLLGSVGRLLCSTASSWLGCSMLVWGSLWECEFLNKLSCSWDGWVFSPESDLHCKNVVGFPADGCTVSKKSLNWMWNCGEMLPVWMFKISETVPVCHGEGPRLMLSWAWGSHFLVSSLQA